MHPILIDTNLLVYLYDQNEPVKQTRARQVLDALRQNQMGRLSTQALSEFVNASMRKLTPPLTAGEACEQVSLLAGFWQVFDLTPRSYSKPPAACATTDWPTTTPRYGPRRASTRRRWSSARISMMA
ncbi:MAG: hypothetical protein ABIL11_17640 [Chloroflexota bacterium]